MGKPTISMAIFNSYVSLPEGKWDVIGYYLRDCLLFNGSNGEIYIYNGNITGNIEVDKRGTPKSSIYRWILHYKPSILGYLHLWKPP